MPYLDYLTYEAKSIIRYAFETFQPTSTLVLFSGGKDSCVVNHLVTSVMNELGFSYPNLLTIDTGYNFPEVTRFLQGFPFLNTFYVEDSIKKGTVPTRLPGESRNADQAQTLKEAIAFLKPTAVFCGARRDEDRARAKERVFSHRDREGNWRPENQRMEVFGHYADLNLQPGEHFRVFPISNWLEVDVWQYIRKHDISIPSLYFSHQREGYDEPVRFRTVGDMLVTRPVPSQAATLDEIILEVHTATLSERGATRLDDKAMSMEQRKRGGYF